MTIGNTQRAKSRRKPAELVTTDHAYKNIVVALDGSELAELALTHVEPLVKKFNSTVTCICAAEPISREVISESSVGFGYVLGADLAAIDHEIWQTDKSYLDSLRKRLAKKGLKVRCEEPKDRAADAILASARRNHADLIAMTTHGRTGIGRTLLGSVADEVVRRATCPVLLVRRGGA